MQLSSRVIKSTVIDDRKVISAPAPEVVIPKIISIQNEEINIEDIYEKVKQEAAVLRNQILKEADERAKSILSDAGQKAQSLLNSSREEGFQQGYRRGYQEGYDYGVSEANKSSEKTLQSAEEYLSSCHEAGKRYINENQKEIIGLGIEIARKILNTELTLNSEAIFKMTESILSKVIDKSHVTIKVNPLDYNFIKNRRDELSIYVEDINSLLIVADSSVEHGSIKAETPSGFIDGDINTQLDIILKKLLEG